MYLESMNSIITIILLGVLGFGLIVAQMFYLCAVIQIISEYFRPYPREKVAYIVITICSLSMNIFLVIELVNLFFVGGFFLFVYCFVCCLWASFVCSNSFFWLLAL